MKEYIKNQNRSVNADKNSRTVVVMRRPAAKISRNGTSMWLVLRCLL